MNTFDPGEKEAVAWALEFFLDVTYDDMRDPEDSGIDEDKFRLVAKFYHALVGAWRLNGTDVQEVPWYMEKDREVSQPEARKT